jgi:SAM-dependent methyltransferase
MDNSAHYTSDFYSGMRSGSRRSAQEILPLVFQEIPCRSVVDVGCGVGTWLRVCKELGAAEITGIDGDYVRPEELEIDAKEFHPMDLSGTLRWDHTYDLAMSLEVAEHLPASAADEFVHFLTSLAPVVLFSASIPGQGGTNHINEQWPDYWAARFEERGYRTLDYIRPRVWMNENVERWYAQNVILFARGDFLASRPVLQALAAGTQRDQLALVHPRTLDAALTAIRSLQEEVARLDPDNLRLRELLRVVPKAIKCALKNPAEIFGSPTAE